ncbi:hypothetical protein CLTEP_26230 [Clostridium tepidiprofundi DSM 19306]|uniref:Uncharacterized protein n=1 Tax=Clostridium tepidiprofundi DSM 19306 TaxID=1121338 RepID=A0A151AS81_9CLOT|nr:hypothetical protein [Clostridium tepidiprofundi]KYH30499.1 hypothetical protein CLTEP_26230 [Clostridium tepidiprofundi DSM 19306]
MSNNGIMVNSRPRIIEKDFTVDEIRKIIEKAEKLYDLLKYNIDDPLKEVKKFKTLGEELKSMLESMGLIKAVEFGAFGGFLTYLIFKLIDSGIEANEEAYTELENNFKDTMISLYRVKNVMEHNGYTLVKMQVVFIDFLCYGKIYDCPIGTRQKGLYRDGHWYLTEM